MNMAWKANRASTFAVRAFGYLVRNPEVHVGVRGTYCRFCLIGEDSTEGDEHGRFMVIVQRFWFVATHALGAAIAQSSRKGDQLFVEGKLRRHHWTAKGWNEDITFVVTGFRHGGRKDGRGAAGIRMSRKGPFSPVKPGEQNWILPVLT
jgi:single-stranded DNA-binding protein